MVLNASGAVLSFLFIYKEKSGASKFKSSPENVTRVIYKQDLHFRTLFRNFLFWY